MRFGEEQQQRLAECLLKSLVDSGVAVLKAEPAAVRDRIVAILRQELDRDQELDREAEKLLAAHLKNAPPGVDRQKLLQMIRKRLAEE